MSEQQKDEKSKYYSLSEAWEDVSYSDGGDKVVNSFKLLGKGLFNVGKFIATEAVPGIVEENIRKSSAMLKNDNLTDEQRAKFEDIRDRSLEAREKLKKD